MKVAKEISPDDKKRGAAPAGGRAALWSAGGCFCYRLLAFLGAGDARRKGRRRGDGLPVVACLAAAGLRVDGLGGGNSAVFNQPLTTFLVVAMVLRITVFLLCSYCLFRRRMGAIPVPWGLGGGGWSGGGLG